MPLEELRKEKAGIEVKLDLLKKRYEELKCGDEEYYAFKEPLISRLEEINSQIEDESPKDPEKESLTDDEQDYADLKSAEDEVSSELIRDSVFAFILILVAGFGLPLIGNILLSYAAVGFISWVAFFHLISYSNSLGYLRAKRYEVAYKIYEGGVNYHSNP